MSRYGRGYSPDRYENKVYVGNLPSDASRTDLETAFMKFGHVKNVWVARNPPGFAFIFFDDKRDAEDAVEELDDTHLCGVKVRVEMSSGESRRSRGRGFRPGGFRPRRNIENERCYECGQRGHFARDCRDKRRRSPGGYRSSRRSRSYSRSRSRSPRRRRVSRSPPRYRSRSRSRSRNRSGSYSQTRSHVRSRSRSRS
ncbi:serine/arginine-rich splicing factor 7-like [Lytechinus variegatus]|uniref:serine/arginine-rich splicing factor 7-like n=1 Tax=Lytechinus variegatus TaxID=7654 RepID=UPI001BB26EAF|nr:serine/arginine-rich splicing factor 7-like [Lytechinus variegatus]XP_041460288.1 serine/arginine-rich splicing factor 7-like [Lytechinus variegatus]